MVGTPQTLWEPQEHCGDPKNLVGTLWGSWGPWGHSRNPTNLVGTTGTLWRPCEPCGDSVGITGTLRTLQTLWGHPEGPGNLAGTLRGPRGQRGKPSGRTRAPRPPGMGWFAGPGRAGGARRAGRCGSGSPVRGGRSRSRRPPHPRARPSAPPPPPAAAGRAGGARAPARTPGDGNHREVTGPPLGLRARGERARVGRGDEGSRGSRAHPVSPRGSRQ